MDEPTRTLVDVAAALGRRDGAALEQALSAAATSAPAAEVEEVLLQCYLFLGYPAALNAIALWRRISGRPAPESTPDSWERWGERGAEVCARIYAGQYERLRGNIAALHPDMERWMVTEGYGKVLGRESLDLPRRELCTVAMLAGLDAVPQLYAHLRGALNAGATRADVEETIERIAPGLTDAAATMLRETWRSVLGRRGGQAATGV